MRLRAILLLAFLTLAAMVTAQDDDHPAPEPEKSPDVSPESDDKDVAKSSPEPEPEGETTPKASAVTILSGAPVILFPLIAIFLSC